MIAPRQALPEELFGKWTLKEAFAVGPDGERLFDVYGDTPSGLISYSRDGWMMALITHGGRPLLDGDRQAAPQGQLAEAYKSCIAYAGPFSYDDGWLLHHVAISTYPNWVGQVLRRALHVHGNTAELLTAPQMQDGQITVMKLVWERIGTDCSSL